MTWCSKVKLNTLRSCWPSSRIKIKLTLKRKTLRWKRRSLQKHYRLIRREKCLEILWSTCSRQRTHKRKSTSSFVMIYLTASSCCRIQRSRRWLNSKKRSRTSFNKSSNLSMNSASPRSKVWTKSCTLCKSKYNSRAIRRRPISPKSSQSSKDQFVKFLSLMQFLKKSGPLKTTPRNSKTRSSC